MPVVKKPCELRPAVEADHGTAEIVAHAFNDKAARDQARGSEGMAHDINSRREYNASSRRDFIKIESGPFLNADPGSRFNAD
ncbi:hypothetical protein [Methylosinus sp. RM1]|uniref:hypothetical protein n=1 Tax=Methylosinus sp. RM1 TaxID=2583817 RepID=UPI001409156B|nr:hypothetical protein [Methylosinus sp. RM1]